MNEIKLILDSNEYILYFNNSSQLLENVVTLPNIKIFINNLIFREIIRNIRRVSMKSFIRLLKNPKVVVIKEKIPDHLTDKYKRLGLKKGDQIIAAFCEYIQVDYLISENRDFLKKKFEFKVVNLKEFLKIVK